MKRTLYIKLLEWKNSNSRKPLLLQGARQVGKTYLVSSFGHEEYENFIYINFEFQPSYKELFSKALDPKVIIENIGYILEKNITHINTLIFFDEIQLCPEAITSLKYFQEKANEFHIIAAGSLLGVSIGKQSSFPVGKVNFLTMYPMSFYEFLCALDQESLANKIMFTTQKLENVIHEKLIDLMKLYLFIGGMPEVVSDYIKNRNMVQVREIQNEILVSYQNDFSKYTDKVNAIKLSELWRTIPYQLARENKKFKYSEVKHKARAANFETTIEWLKNAGLIHIVPIIRTAKLPLAGYADYSKFKIYMLDTGLLGAMLDISSELITRPDALFSEYNGAFIENYVCIELIKHLGKSPFYWNSDREAEVDFVFQMNDKIIPLEVKSGMDTNTKSIRSYAEKYAPNYIIRASPRIYSQHEIFLNIALYEVMRIERFVE
jgi:uncharacterized protein